MVKTFYKIVPVLLYPMHLPTFHLLPPKLIFSLSYHNLCGRGLVFEFWLCSKKKKIKLQRGASVSFSTFRLYCYPTTLTTVLLGVDKDNYLPSNLYAVSYAPLQSYYPSQNWKHILTQMA